MFHSTCRCRAKGSEKWRRNENASKRHSVETACMTVGNPLPPPHPTPPHPTPPQATPLGNDETQNAEYSAIIPVKSALLPKVVQASTLCGNNCGTLLTPGARVYLLWPRTFIKSKLCNGDIWGVDEVCVYVYICIYSSPRVMLQQEILLNNMFQCV